MGIRLIFGFFHFSMLFPGCFEPRLVPYAYIVGLARWVLVRVRSKMGIRLISGFFHFSLLFPSFFDLRLVSYTYLAGWVRWMLVRVRSKTGISPLRFAVSVLLFVWSVGCDSPIALT